MTKQAQAVNTSKTNKQACRLIVYLMHSIIPFHVRPDPKSAFCLFSVFPPTEQAHLARIFILLLYR